MEASPWGGRIVIASVIGIILATASLSAPYYMIGDSDHYVYLTNSYDSPYPDPFHSLRTKMTVFVSFYVLLSLAYLWTVMEGARRGSLYLGAGTCAFGVVIAAYFALEASRVQRGGDLAWGFLAFVLAIVLMVTSTGMRGWSLSYRSFDSGADE